MDANSILIGIISLKTRKIEQIIFLTLKAMVFLANADPKCDLAQRVGNMPSLAKLYHLVRAFECYVIYNLLSYGYDPF